MDRGGRVLRSVSEAVAPAFALPRLVVAGPPATASAREIVRPRGRLRRMPRRPSSVRLWLFVEAHPRLVGYVLASLLVFSVTLYGLVCNGQYAAFVEREGSLPDMIARDLGFGIKAVTISGISELPETEVLAAAGIDVRSSLAFLDAADVRRKLMAQPLVRNAAVTKLYPNRLLVAITEREPYALWQKDGVVSIIGADGTAIDERRDDRHDDLPFVVGENANAHIGEYVKLIGAAGDLKTKIRAGTLVAERRWDLTMTSGVVVKLPELDASAALATLARLERDGHILQKDIISLDLRVRGRVIARLTEEAAAARAEVASRKTGKARGGRA
jgi:cell division protein FtsQ